MLTYLIFPEKQKSIFINHGYSLYTQHDPAFKKELTLFSKKGVG